MFARMKQQPTLAAMMLSTIQIIWIITVVVYKCMLTVTSLGIIMTLCYLKTHCKKKRIPFLHLCIYVRGRKIVGGPIVKKKT